jgi:transcriptional regulator of met regulon
MCHDFFKFKHLQKPQNQQVKKSVRHNLLIARQITNIHLLCQRFLQKYIYSPLQMN